MNNSPEQISSNILAGKQALILIDGDCLLCKRSALWLARRDTHNVLLFANLNDLRSAYQHIPDHTLVLLVGGNTYTGSSAILLSAKLLGGLWKLLAQLLAAVPPHLRDRIYATIAKKRHKLSAACQALPGKDALVLKEKTLDAAQILLLFSYLTRSKKRYKETKK